MIKRVMISQLHTTISQKEHHECYIYYIYIQKEHC